MAKESGTAILTVYNIPRNTLVPLNVKSV